MNGIDLIKAERERHDGLGYTAEHDDKHIDGEIARAAACYAVSAPIYLTGSFGELPVWPGAWCNGAAESKAGLAYIDQLIIAGALIAAEVDRLLRSGIQPNHVR